MMLTETQCIHMNIWFWNWEILFSRSLFIFSLSHVTVSITFWRILTRIHIHVKEVQMKSIQVEKSKISSKTLGLFLHGELNMNENKFLMEIYIGKCWHLFSNRKLFGIPCKFVTLSFGLFLCQSQCKLHVGFSFLAVLGTWQARGRVLKQKSWDFFIGLNEHRWTLIYL